MKMVNLHTHQLSGEAGVLEILNRYPWEELPSEQYFSIGIHPWHVKAKNLDGELQQIRKVAESPYCLAIGECGLDKRKDVPLELQERALEAQLEIAKDLQKPVIIHCVAAFSELIRIKKRQQFSNPIVIHGFSKNTELARQVMDNGFHLSFGKYLLRNPELEQVFTAIPEDRFFLETDMVEENITAVYNLAARYRTITTGDLKHRVWQNFKTVFAAIGRDF